VKTHKLTLDQKLLHLGMGIILGVALWGATFVVLLILN
jgi:hypothetical protein